MIPVKEASRLYDMTPHRLKQIIKESHLDVVKLPNGYIRIPNDTMSKLNKIRKLDYLPRIVTVGMEKGGIGKTIISINLAICAARKGLRVLICDFDPECCASLFLAPDDTDWEDLGSIREVFLNEKKVSDYVIPSRFDGLDFLPSKSRVRKIDRQLDGLNPKYFLKKVIQDLVDQYDLILFDIPPSFNNLCRASYLSSDVIICPVLDDVFSIDSLHLTIEDIEEACEEFDVAKPTIKVLRNRFSTLNPDTGNKRIRKASIDIGAELNREFADKLLPLQVRETESVKNALNNGLSFYDSPKDARIEDVKTAIEDLFQFIQSTDQN